MLFMKCLYVPQIDIRYIFSINRYIFSPYTCFSYVYIMTVWNIPEFKHNYFKFYSKTMPGTEILYKFWKWRLKSILKNQNQNQNLYFPFYRVTTVYFTMHIHSLLDFSYTQCTYDLWESKGKDKKDGLDSQV
jgi:hypothetical protein